MSAYDEKYLDDAMKNLGECFDYAVNTCNKTADDFANLFIASGIADFFGKGNPKYVAGKSGTELALDIFEKTGEKIDFMEARIEYECSSEYWAGWILAYYQWRSGRSFRDIFDYVSMDDVLKMYPTLHEASEEKFVDTLNNIIGRKKRPTKLQLQRKRYGCSQKELAERSGVNLRTLQQYELGTKDINKAALASVLSMANVLGCGVEDIIEI